jgi:hypothetical protein
MRHALLLPVRRRHSSSPTPPPPREVTLGKALDTMLLFGETYWLAFLPASQSLFYLLNFTYESSYSMLFTPTTIDLSWAGAKYLGYMGQIDTITYVI